MAEQIIRKTFKYRIYPSKAQITRLNQTLDLCAELYNAALQERRDAWRLNRKSISRFSQSRQLPEIKEIRPELKDVHSQVLQEVLARLDRAFERFFRRVESRNGKAGYPRFRSFQRYTTFTYPQPGHLFRDRKLYVPKIGNVKIKLHRAIEGKVKTLTISRSTTGKWYAFISTQNTSVLAIDPEGRFQVGVDVGLTHFATLSTGEKVCNQRFYRQDQHILAKAQRKFRKAKPRTQEWGIRRQVVSRIHERIRFRRAEFAHQLSARLVSRFSLIVFERLNFAGLQQNRHLAKSIQDAAWSQFVQFTFYKAENAGKKCVQVNPYNTSKLTACCGELVADLTLKDRVIHCPRCHSETDRDWNAALNILARGLAGVGVNP